MVFKIKHYRDDVEDVIVDMTEEREWMDRNKRDEARERLEEMKENIRREREEFEMRDEDDYDDMQPFGHLTLIGMICLAVYNMIKF